MNHLQTEGVLKYTSVLPKPPFRLMEAPLVLSNSRSESAGSGLSVINADSNSDDERPALFHPKPIDVSRLLPPIGVFWDIENCQVPKRKSAGAIAQAIRDKFFTGYREAEFLVVCDVTKESSKVIEELNYAQVNLIHVSATCKNAADEKLRQSIRRFADIHATPAAIILISSDINFAGDLNDLRHRKKIHVILLHNVNISEALILCANEHYNFGEIVESTINRKEMREYVTAAEVLVSNLPKEKESTKVKNRLKQLCDNLGGRVSIISKSMYSIRFPTLEFATRAQKRMDGEDVFGNKINVSDPVPVEDWSFQSVGTKKTHIKDDLQISHRSNRKIRDDSPLQINDLFSQKQIICADINTSNPYNIHTSFHDQMSKNMVPFFSNNTNSFTFTKIPNIENLKIIQNPTSSYQKSHLNNLETNTGILINDNDHRKHVESRKMNNVFTHQSDSSILRLNNAISNNECEVPRNLPHPSSISYGSNCQTNRTNGNNDATAGRSLRGNLRNNIVNNNNNNNSNNNNNNNNDNGNNFNSIVHDNIINRITPEEDLENFMSGDAFFEPIQKSPVECYTPVDLHISGLDPYMDLMVTKNLLTSIFKMHVGVLSVSVFCLTGGNVVASVKVPTLQDAQYAISQLQRRQIGSRRITIAFQNSSKYHRQLVRSQVGQLLSELPQNKTPLFRFTELFKSRFLNSISVSELNKMKDICIISEEENGRMISANSRSHINSKQEKKESIVPYCPLHAQKTLSDSEPPTLPTVKIGLKLLSERIERLLDSHGGKLPLPSLSDCYQTQFGPLPEDAQGVPLEHLVSCIQGIEVVQSQGSFKHLARSHTMSQNNDDNVKCVSPMLVGTMSVFTREILELLKETPKCILPFSQFIPSYHRRYGRQCRVSDYGYTKLLDLLESLPHVLQVIGNGSYKMVTLSHKAQIRRFTSDLLRILKSQPNKQIELDNFSSQYEKIIARAWDPCHYGLCELEDLLNCVPKSTVIMERRDNGQFLVSIPKREQTPDEIELTKKFAQEVVELLKRVPKCSMAFNRFVPAYHNQFGRQCRVSSYGCFKLIELFESIPDTVVIEEDTRGEKHVVLTPNRRLQVLAERICEILTAEGGTMLLNRLEFAYKFYQCESVISPADYNCDSLEQLLRKIPEYVKIEDSTNGPIVILKNEMDPLVLIPRVRFILLHNEKLTVDQFINAYVNQYGHKIDADIILYKIPEMVKLQKKGKEFYIHLTPLSKFANQMYFLLYDHGGRISLPNFESAYINKFKKSCQPSQFGFPTLSSLLTAIPETVIVENSGYYTHKRIITLNIDLKNAGFKIPVLNNENGQKFLNDGFSHEEKSPRRYDLWKSDSLFPCWKKVNGFIPENIVVPHPSELPLPSSKLSSPIHKLLQTETILRNEVEATSTTDDGTDSSQNVSKKMELLVDYSGKRKNRIAAQFENNLM